MFMEWQHRYVECTSAAIQALASFKKLYPEHRKEEIENCIGKAVEFIEKIQAADGSWFVYILTHNIYLIHDCFYYLSISVITISATFIISLTWLTWYSLLKHLLWAVIFKLLVLSNIDFDRYGSWGVCFTYGGWFGIKGLSAAGRTYINSSTIHKACDFLLSKELATGGWGESYLSCQNKVLIHPFWNFLVFSSLSITDFMESLPE